jgi:hypothetical protein
MRSAKRRRKAPIDAGGAVRSARAASVAACRAASQSFQELIGN